MATFTNQATLSYNGNVANSNIVTGEILETLTATKTALTDSYVTNSEVTYSVNLTNTGTTPITALTISDDLGNYPFGTTSVTPLTYVPDSLRLFINGVVQPDPAVTAGPPLTITGLTIPAGANAMILYRVIANEFAPLGDATSIVNTATITGGGLTAPVTANSTIPFSTEPRLEITKALTPAVVTDNGELTYTLTILNYSSAPADATDNIVVTDTFNPVLDPIAVTFNGTPWTATTNYTYDATTGEFATVNGNITVPAATFTQNAATGAYTVTPGASTIVITGTV